VERQRVVTGVGLIGHSGTGRVSGVQLHPSTQGLGEKGYQGWKKLHAIRMRSERYRNRRRSFGLRWNLITALYNDELGQTGSLLQERAGLSLSNIFARGLLFRARKVKVQFSCQWGSLIGHGPAICLDRPLKIAVHI